MEILVPTINLLARVVAWAASSFFEQADSAPPTTTKLAVSALICRKRRRLT